MSCYAEFEIRCEALPFVAAANEVPQATMTVEMQPNGGDGHRVFLVRVADAPPGAVESAFESVAFVGEYTLIGAVDEVRRYQVTPGVGMSAQLDDAVDDLSELRALATTDSLIEHIRVTRTGWIQAGWFADRGVLEAFREFWHGNGGFTLRRLSRTGDDTPSSDGLTDRQRRALLTASEMGYFAVPRRASLDDVAAELGITASSLSERLRRAQSTLAETVVNPRGDLNGRTNGSRA